MNKIKRARLLKEKTQEQLATEIGVAKNTISSYETYDRFPKLETALRLSDFLEISIDDMFRDFVENRKGQ